MGKVDNILTKLIYIDIWIIFSYFAGPEGFEPPRTVLETVMLAINITALAYR